MHSFAQIDLNLVPTLHALLEERSVTGAARRIGRSQPAVSHALARLREHFGDSLLVRTGRRMALTARGEALLPEVRRTVDALDALWSAAPLDPSSWSTTLRLVTDDLIGVTLLPRLWRALAQQAPQVELDVLPRGAPGRKARVRAGHADVAVGDFSEAGRDLHRAELFTDRWVTVVRRNHGLPAQPSAAAWAQQRHVIVSPTGGRRGVVDPALEAVGLSRQVPVAVPHFATAVALVGASDLLLTTPWTLAQSTGLRVVEPPVALPEVRMSMLWHPRAHADPVQRWFRDLLRDVSARVG